MIKIDIFSDFVCPFCYIGKVQLDKTIDELGLRDEVQINYLAFELRPDAPTEPGTSYIEGVMKKFPSEEYVNENVLGPMMAEAQAVGLDMRFDELDQQNTFDAHRLAKYAKFYGKDSAFFEKGYETIFKDNGFMADADTLVKIATEIGLDADQARAIVEDKEKFAEIVREDEAKAQRMGVNGVPFFIFNDKYSLSGSQGVEAYKNTLIKVNEEGDLIDLSADSKICGPDGCH